MTKLKCYVVGGGNGQRESFLSWLKMDPSPNVEGADLILFRGGTDVNPNLYGEPSHPMTEESDHVRDNFEMHEYRIARHLNKPMVGVCRGAQFLCVMAGGKLVQHQENKGSHSIRVYDNPALDKISGAEPMDLTVTSDHHQAQFPWGIKDGFRVLGWTNGLSRFHQDGNQKEMVNKLHDKEVEICYYPGINALAIQSHPEWAEGERPYMLNLVMLLIEGKL